MRPQSITEMLEEVERGRGLTLAEQGKVVAALRRSLERETTHKRFYLSSEERHFRLFEGIRKALGDFYSYDMVEDVRHVVTLARTSIG